MPGFWRTDEYDRLFERFPLDGPGPTSISVRLLADEMRRNVRPVMSVWQEAHRYVRDGTGDAPPGLRAYLDAQRDQP